MFPLTKSFSFLDLKKVFRFKEIVNDWNATESLEFQSVSQNEKPPLSHL